MFVPASDAIGSTLFRMDNTISWVFLNCPFWLDEIGSERGSETNRIVTPRRQCRKFAGVVTSIPDFGYWRIPPSKITTDNCAAPKCVLFVKVVMSVFISFRLSNEFSFLVTSYLAEYLGSLTKPYLIGATGRGFQVLGRTNVVYLLEERHDERLVSVPNRVCRHIHGNSRVTSWISLQIERY